MKRLTLIAVCLTAAIAVLASTASTDTTETVYSIVKMQVERLPDLRIPRMGHVLMYAGDELVAFGGHTDGFVPTPTAERLTDNGWKMMDMVYTHDEGVAISLSSGKVMLAGGLREEMGVGQTYGVELYDPATHTFKGVGCLDRKRAFASAAEIEGGRVIIAGNWYNDDYIECFDGKSRCDSVAPVSVQRVRPCVLPMAPDDVMIFGSIDTKGNTLSSNMVDRLKGEPLEVQLLDGWHVLKWGAIPHLNSGNCAIGDEKKGEYAYLLPVQNHDGQTALMLVRATEFSLLNTVCPIPMRSPWADIGYYGFAVDRKAQRAYLVGSGQDGRIYVTAVDYAKAANDKGAPLTLYYSDPLAYFGSDNNVALMPEGDLVVAGGSCGSNFEPLASVFRLKVAQSHKAASPWQGMFWVAMAAIVALIAVVMWGGKRRAAGDELEHERQTAESSKQLFERIKQLMDKQQVYLKNELHLADVAAMLQVSQLQMSRCVKKETGEPFTMFANRYRVEHAKRLMLEQPDTKLAAVAFSSGFATEKSFFRVFKAITGLTPKEWLTNNLG